MTIDPRLLEILVCPEDKSTLTEADNSVVTRLNEEIKSGKITNRAGRPVQEPMDTGLIRADGKFLYPIRNGIPIMLIEEAIPL